MTSELDWILGFVGEKGFDPEKHRKRVAAYRAKRRGSGLCIDCGQPKTNNLLQCEGCRDKGKQTITRRRYERSAAGLCYDCGKSPSTGKGTRCIGCAEKVAEVARNIRRMKRERVESTPGGGSPRVSPKDRPPRKKASRNTQKVGQEVRQQREDEASVQVFYEEQARLRGQGGQEE